MFRIKVFLCHSSEDKPVVSELYNRLLANDWLDPWLDKEKLLPGQDFDTEIEKAIESADAVIAFISKNAISKTGYIQKELKLIYNAAMYKPDGQIFAIPLRLEECTSPHSLKLWHWGDYFGSEKEKTYEFLLKSLKTVYEVKAEELASKEAAKERVERETAEKSANEKAEKKAAEKARLEAEEQARQKAEREAAEKTIREKAEKDTAEKAQFEADELIRQESAIKSVREKLVSVIVQNIANEKARLEAEEQSRQSAERESAENSRLETEETAILLDAISGKPIKGYSVGVSFYKALLEKTFVSYERTGAIKTEVTTKTFKNFETVKIIVDSRIYNRAKFLSRFSGWGGCLVSIMIFIVGVALSIGLFYIVEAYDLAFLPPGPLNLLCLSSPFVLFWGLALYFNKHKNELITEKILLKQYIETLWRTNGLKKDEVLFTKQEYLDMKFTNKVVSKRNF